MASEYDLLRQRLDDQLRADIEMIYTAYLAKVRACETLAAGQGESRPPLPLGNALPGQAGITVVVAPSPAPALPPGTAAALPQAPAAPALPPAPPVPAPAARRRRTKAANHELFDAVVTVLDRLPEVFDKNDLLRLLPVKPHRGTLFRILQELVYQHKVIVHVPGTGLGGPNRYRRVAPAPPPGN